MPLTSQSVPETIKENKVPPSKENLRTTTTIMDLKITDAELKTVFENPDPEVISTCDFTNKVERFVGEEPKNDNDKESFVSIKRIDGEIKLNMQNKTGAEPGAEPTTIFSIKGAPSRKPRKVDRTSNILGLFKETELEKVSEKVSSLSKLATTRNPLTGVGVSSNDEFKTKRVRRKDGNPVLGIGYEDKRDQMKPSGSTPRIPPGGYSSGLW